MFSSHLFTHSHHSRPQTPSSSRPPSRPPSPTRTNTRTSLNSTHSSSTIPISSSSTSAQPSSATSSTFPHAPTYSRQSTFSSIVTDSTDPLDTSGGDGSTINSPVYGSYTQSEMTWNSGHHSSGANTPGGYHTSHGNHLEIVLDSDNLVMRGQGGDMNPAYLTGRLELDLAEKANVKEITMTLTGKAKVQFVDHVGAKHHHFTHPVYHYDWSFLAGDKNHSHTLKAGFHSFPFNLMLDSELPSSIHSFSSEGIVQYKLRATVVRSGFSSNFQAMKEFQLGRTYVPDALEFNQTLEIENTWPGKVMYSLTLPFKAYAAGDDIPICVKFMPLAKGVRVTSVITTLKEYTMVQTRHSSHQNERQAAQVKHEFVNGQARQMTEDPSRPPPHLAAKFATWQRRPSRAVLATLPQPSNIASSSTSDNVNATDEEIAQDLMHGDDEVETNLFMFIPPWTTPTHTVSPVFVTHKLKWSCTITNPDGHISELRCALPIIILDYQFLEEARTAGASTRALLLGQEDDTTQQVDLPSYSNHVYDRVATADSGPATGYTSRSSRTPTGTHTPASNPTPPLSRPASPTRGLSSISGNTQPDEEDHHIVDLGNPERRQLSFEADAELLRALGALEAHSHTPSPAATPSGSRGPSRPISRRGSFTRSGRASNVNSRPGSRVGSRANSPERGGGGSGSGSGSHGTSYEDGTGSSFKRSGLAARLHLPGTFKTLKPLSKPILKNNSTSNLLNVNDDSSMPRNASFPVLDRTVSPGNGLSHVSFHHSTAGHDGSRRKPASRPIALSGGSGPSSSASTTSNGLLGVNGHGHGHGHHRPGFHLAQDSPSMEEENIDPISRVPNYDIARRGFASAMDTGLPTYDDSNAIERTKSDLDISRARSDTALAEIRGSGTCEAAVSGDVDGSAVAAAERASQIMPEGRAEVEQGSASAPTAPVVITGTAGGQAGTNPNTN